MAHLLRGCRALGYRQGEGTGGRTEASLNQCCLGGNEPRFLRRVTLRLLAGFMPWFCLRNTVWGSE